MKRGNRIAPLSAVLIASSMALSACSGLGEGVLPVNAVIQPFGGLEGATSAKTYACINSGLTFIVDFSDGSRGDFTGRATYSSSNPGVVQVSNFDIPVPEQTNAFYNRGTLVPVAEGTATITVRYLTFTRSIDVTVGTPTNFRIAPASADLATKSLLDLTATADLDGVETVLDALVTWAFVTPNASVASISSTSGTITGVAPGSGLTARVRVPGCAALTADAPVAVANLQSLALTREFGDNARLIVNTTERLTATGTLDNGKTQDLSTQVSYTSSDVTALSFLGGGLPNVALAVKAVADSVQLAASFASTPAIAAPAIGITPVADSLNTIAISPAAVDVAAGRTNQFSAVGSYASGATQDISRHVGWTSSDNALATVQSSSSLGVNGLAGLATTTASAAGKSVTVTASTTNAASQPITATATLNIK